MASLVGVADGASALHWGFVAAPGADGASLRIHTQRRDQGTWADAGTFACRIPAAVEAAPVAVRMPCALEPAEYRFILEADSEPVGPGYFPRQISFGLTSLSVEPRSAEGS